MSIEFKADTSTRANNPAPCAGASHGLTLINLLWVLDQLIETAASGCCTARSDALTDERGPIIVRCVCVV
jgi:hypothetical protein